MFTGNTPAGELAESHSAMVNAVAAEVGAEPEVAHA
jgi:hypothetical protein